LHNGNVGVIGDTLADARTRRAVDLEEVHAATGIRPRYLEAIEQEDWDALPEEFYARAFIRKYAQYLEADPGPLVEEYKRQQGGGARGEAPTSPFARTRSRRAEALRRRRKRQSVYAWIAALGLLAAIVVAVVLISSSGGEDGGAKPAKGTATKAGAQGEGQGRREAVRHRPEERREGRRRNGDPAEDREAEDRTDGGSLDLRRRREGEGAGRWSDARRRRSGGPVPLALLHRRLRQRIGPRPGRREDAEDARHAEPDGDRGRLPWQGPRTPGRQTPKLRIAGLFDLTHT
jgi:hypothetical protein